MISPCSRKVRTVASWLPASRLISGDLDASSFSNSACALSNYPSNANAVAARSPQASRGGRSVQASW